MFKYTLVRATEKDSNEVSAELALLAFREDLNLHPNNVWSLWGALKSKSLLSKNKSPSIQTTEKKIFRTENIEFGGNINENSDFKGIRGIKRRIHTIKGSCCEFGF